MSKFLQFCFIIILSALLCLSCKNESDSTGAIKISRFVTAVGWKIGLSRASVPGYYVVLSGPEERVIPYPDGGLIDNLTPGSYTMIVTDWLGEIPAPSTNHVIHRSEDIVEVRGGRTTEIEICTYFVQARLELEFSRLFSTYGLTDLNVLVNNSDGYLTYTEIQNHTGYFAPGQIVITANNGGESLKINGKESMQFQLASCTWYDMYVSHDDTNPGNVRINLYTNWH